MGIFSKIFNSKEDTKEENSLEAKKEESLTEFTTDPIEINSEQDVINYILAS